LVDADAQGHATIAFGLPKSPGFYDFVVRNAPFNEVMQFIPPERYAVPDEAADISGQLYVIPSNQESRSISGQVSDAAIILKRLQMIGDAFHFVIFDTSPTPSLLHSSIAMATDAVIFPTTCERWAFDGLSETMGHVSQFQPFRERFGLGPVETLGIVPIMYRGRTVEHSENYRELKEAFGKLVWPPIPSQIIWSEAAGMNRPVFSIAPDSHAAAHAWRIVDSVERMYVSA
jgi:cellulose biosynthesis protein BcsQ